MQVVELVCTAIDRTTGAVVPGVACSINDTHDPIVSEANETVVVWVNVVAVFQSTVVSPVAVPCTCMLEDDTAAMVPLAAIFGRFRLWLEGVVDGVVVLVLDAVEPHAASTPPPISRLSTMRTVRFMVSSLTIRTVEHRSARVALRVRLGRRRIED
ncbi:MAG: hypothetical protein ACYDHP_05090 [Ferrimicrobium sp.]